MRLAALIVALLLPGASVAQAPYRPCPSVTAGWSKQYATAITSIQYSQDQFLLYVIFNNTVASAFSGVPIGVMQNLSNTTNPVPYYNSFIVPSFHALMLASQNNCPLLNENGVFLWTD